MALPQPVLRDMASRKLGKQLQQKCCLGTAMTTVYWESGPYLVVDLGTKEHATYPGVLQQQRQQGLMQLTRWVLAALVP